MGRELWTSSGPRSCRAARSWRIPVNSIRPKCRGDRRSSVRGRYRHASEFTNFAEYGCFRRESPFRLLVRRGRSGRTLGPLRYGAGVAASGPRLESIVAIQGERGPRPLGHDGDCIAAVTRIVTPQITSSAREKRASVAVSAGPGHLT